MATNWDTVLQQAVAAAKTAVGGAWNTAGISAQHSVALLVQTAAYIAANSGDLDADEQKVLIDNQKLAMQNVLLGYQDVGIVIAEQAVAAAWGIIEPALLAAIHVG